MGCGASTKSKNLKKVVAEPLVEAAQACEKACEKVADKVKVHVGPLEVGTDGVAVKPKFNFGVTGPSVYMLAGVRDVRDGLAVEGFGMIHKDYMSKGSSLTEVLENIKAVDAIPLLDDLIVAVPEAIAAVLSEIHIDLAVEGLEAEGVVFVFVGAGVTAGVYLGWLDTKGYGMIGVEGRCATAASIGLSVRAGLHESGEAVRVVMWLGNVGYDAVVKLKKPRLDKAEPQPDEQGADGKDLD
mmetsp:Transcript_36076/g.90729  ORF Transcript_36076/g.90729 Transcript_36076/m.90729 type:complete len:241 (-) Transcript_36076:176-898(-)